jgi:hypothetical protein
LASAIPPSVPIKEETLMETRRFKFLVLWNAILTVLLVASVGVNAMWAQAAADPPVKVFSTTLDDAGIDFGNAANKNISSTTFTQVASVPATLSASHIHYCIVTASVGTDWNGQGQYTIGIGYDDNTQILPYSKREFEFIDQVIVNHEDFQEVSTQLGVSAFPGNHTFYLLAKKNSTTSSYLVIDRAVMTVVCLANQI